VLWEIQTYFGFSMLFCLLVSSLYRTDRQARYAVQPIRKAAQAIQFKHVQHVRPNMVPTKEAPKTTECQTVAWFFQVCWGLLWHSKVH